MATKRKHRVATKKTSKPKKAAATLTRQARSEIEYLETLIKFDERNIDGSGSSMDQLFTNQRDRTRAKIEALRAAK